MRLPFGKGKRSLPPVFDRMLGPTEPQVTCDECFAQIDRYVDLEASGIDASSLYPEMRAHLEGCPACKEEHDDMLAFLLSRDAG